MRTLRKFGGVLSELTNFYPLWFQKRLELGLRAKDTVLISVGRLDKNKNNSTLIKAVSLCDNPSIHLVICGDGEERELLSNLAKELGIETQIHLLGNRSDMKELYDMADVFVMASYREGLSRSIMEAMASGLPCVVSDIRGNRDLIADKTGGFLCTPTNSCGFAMAISSLYSDSTLCEKMSKHNKMMIKKFDVSVVEKAMVSIYSEV